jgi:hypothetical protein
MSRAAARARRGPPGEVGRPAGQVLQRDDAPGGRLPGVPGHWPDGVVIGQHPGRQRADGGVLGQGRVDGVAQRRGLPRRDQEVEGEGGVQLVRPDVAGQPLRPVHPGLGDEDPGLVVRVRHGPPVAVDVVHLVPVPVRVLAGRPGRRVGEQLRRLPAAHVRQALLLDQRVRHVDAEAVHPEVEQKRSVFSKSARTSGWVQSRSGCSAANRCRYHSPGRPSGSVTRVHAVVPKTLRQSFGGSPPPGPRPGRNRYRRRSADPGPAATAARNHRCWSDVWLGTMSSSTRRPTACASSTSASRRRAVRPGRPASGRGRVRGGPAGARPAVSRRAGRARPRPPTAARPAAGSAHG